MILQILGLGAIGLGFLLAVLAYKLLAANPANRGSIYIFMAFCLVIMGTGAFLQYAAADDKSKVKNVDAEVTRLRAGMKSIQEALARTEKPLREANSIVTDGGACPGGSHGVALPHGRDASGYISGAQGEISSAKSTASQFRP